MGIAMFTLANLLAPLLARHPRDCERVAQPAHREAPLRALRVIRVAEPSRACAGAGRMRISGRMADVCAELDRLAALEAAAS